MQESRKNWLLLLDVQYICHARCLSNHANQLIIVLDKKWRYVFFVLVLFLKFHAKILRVNFPRLLDLLQKQRAHEKVLLGVMSAILQRSGCKEIISISLSACIFPNILICEHGYKKWEVFSHDFFLK